MAISRRLLLSLFLLRAFSSLPAQAAARGASHPSGLPLSLSLTLSAVFFPAHEPLRVVPIGCSRARFVRVESVCSISQLGSSGGHESTASLPDLWGRCLCLDNFGTSDFRIGDDDVSAWTVMKSTNSSSAI
jgi:hypothetical protein